MSSLQNTSLMVLLGSPCGLPERGCQAVGGFVGDGMGSGLHMHYAIQNVSVLLKMLYLNVKLKHFTLIF